MVLLKLSENLGKKITVRYNMVKYIVELTESEYKIAKSLLKESLSVREATKEEYEYAFKKVVQNEINKYYSDKSKEEQENAYNDFLDDLDKVWRTKTHAYTTDGTDSFVLTPNKDGSNYIYLMYIEPEKRNGISALSMFKQALKDSPDGLSFHTNKMNKLAKAAKRYGFVEYPSSHSNEIFMSNKEGIDGNEWWENSNIPE